MNFEIQTNQERRIFDRFPARFPAKIKDSRDEFGMNMSLRDACAEGARLIVRERLFVHDTLALEIKLPDADYPMTMHGQVKWIRKREFDGWDVGLKLHKIDLLRMSRLYKFFVDPT